MRRIAVLLAALVALLVIAAPALSATDTRTAPAGLSAKTTPGRDRTKPFTFTTIGKLRKPPSPVITCPPGAAPPSPYCTPASNAQQCSGKVAVQFKAGAKTISTRRVPVTSACAYKSKVTFSIASRLHPKTLKVVVRFLGNDVFKPKAAPTTSVRVF